MADSAFNPETFLETAFDGELSTAVIPIPAGEHQAQVDDVLKPRQTEVNGEQRWVMDVVWAVIDEDVKKITGRDKPTVRQGCFLDLTASGGIDGSDGKNLTLGKVREALGQNKKGQKWNPRMMVGGMAKIKIKHNPNPNDPNSPYANVESVAKLR